MAIVSLNGTNCFPVCDGNGNVMGLVTTSGTIAAEYEYSPVGVTLKAVGPLAKANPIRWSTKPTDDETGVVSFQARPYWPQLAIFMTRDPIEEQGGLNLYGICGGDCVNRFDSYGLVWGNTPEGANLPFTKRDVLNALGFAQRNGIFGPGGKSWGQVYLAIERSPHTVMWARKGGSTPEERISDTKAWNAPDAYMAGEPPAGEPGDGTSSPMRMQDDLSPKNKCPHGLARDKSGAVTPSAYFESVIIHEMIHAYEQVTGTVIRDREEEIAIAKGNLLDNKIVQLVKAKRY